MGSKNHEIVPTLLITRISRLKNGGVHKILGELAKHGLVARVQNAKYDGYRLTYGGYDYLALHALSARGVIYSVGNQIGVGKESDIYIVADEHGNQRVLKLHRLGRASFRAIKNKRDYLQNRKAASWMYMSRLAATREFAFMQALHDHRFPVPEPIDQNRHCVVMGLVDGIPLTQVSQVADPGALYADLIALILRLASHGLVHGDFNEFNLLVREHDQYPFLIDFPQMISTKHFNSIEQFNRDVNCVRAYFKKKFDFEPEWWPEFERDVERSVDLDAALAASGACKLTKKQHAELDEFLALHKSADESSFDGDDLSESSTDHEEMPEPAHDQQSINSSSSSDQSDIDKVEEDLDHLCLDKSDRLTGPHTSQPNCTLDDRFMSPHHSNETAQVHPSKARVQKALTIDDIKTRINASKAKTTARPASRNATKARTRKDKNLKETLRCAMYDH